MNMLVPGALGALALAGPLIVLYMLRSRRARIDVSSNMLWTAQDEQITSAVPWSPLRWSVLLLLQLLVLALFAISLARPFFAEATLLGPHSVLIMDTSGSMAEADRFTEAQRRAMDLAADTSGEKVVSVIEAGPNPRVVLSYSRLAEDVQAAISSIEVGGGEADLSSAIRLGRGLATPDRPTSLIVFSDGGAGPLPEEPVIDLTHDWVDAIEDDVAVEVLTVESTGGVTRGLVAVANHAQTPTEVEVEVSVGGATVDTLVFQLAANDRQSQVFPLDAQPGSEIIARRIGEPDGNPLDDTVHAVVEQGLARGVQIDGQNSPFLTALVHATPGFEIVDDGDILIVDGGALPQIDRPTWVIRSDTLPSGLEADGFVENALATFQAPGEPVLDAVDLSELAVAEMQAVEPRGWSPIVRSGPHPLVLLGTVDGYRVVYFTFDLTHSNLPIQVSFPILGAALLDWLAGDASTQVSAADAGTPLTLTPPPGSTVRVELPDSSTVTLPAGASEYIATNQPGVYRVTYVDSEGAETTGPVAVRNFVAGEAGAPVREIAVARAGAAALDESFLIREWAPELIAALLALLIVEWWVGHQRPWPRRST